MEIWKKSGKKVLDYASTLLTTINPSPPEISISYYTPFEVPDPHLWSIKINYRIHDSKVIEREITFNSAIVSKATFADKKVIAKLNLDNNKLVRI